MMFFMKFFYLENITQWFDTIYYYYIFWYFFVRIALLREGGVRVCAAVHPGLPHLCVQGAGGLSPRGLSGLALQSRMVSLHVQL
jgi:hypothetical protein